MRRIIVLLLTAFSVMYADAPNTCDVLAANPENKLNPSGVTGVEFKDVNTTKAIEACEKAVKDFPDETRYSYQLGRAYDKSNNYQKAFEWYKKAALKDYALAQNGLGVLYLFHEDDKDFKESEGEWIAEIGTQESYEKSLAWYLKAAKNGNTSAQNSVASAYYNAKGVKKDYKKALKWYMKASDNNSSYAQKLIGEMYQQGKGVKKDDKEAFKWYMKASDQNNTDAKFKIIFMYLEGKGVDENQKKAFEIAKELAEDNHLKAQSLLGHLYKQGIGVKKDYKKAFEWTKKAADANQSIAQKNMGNMYCDGQGVKKDCKEAFKWYMKAAEQDDIDAIEQVAMRYWFGYAPDGDQRSRKKAFKWYMRAAKLNSAYAQNQVADAYYEGDGTRKNYKQAFKWHLKAAKQDNYLSQMDIGKMYANGLGTVANYVKAYAWLSIALTNFPKVSDFNDEIKEIQKYLNKLESKLSHKQIDIAQNYDPRQSDNIPKSNSKNKLSKNRTGIGTGFFINTSNVVTNHHVVEECSSIELVRGEYRADAKIIVDDSRNDLAVLKTGKTNDKYLKLRAGKSIRIGEEIIVLGYPLGKLLGSGIKLTTGDVSSMTGLLDDSTNMQISAPVQPGNSGGPLLDKSGNVVGVIYSRVEKTLSGRSTQNVNLAIKSNILQMLLDTKNIEYNVASSKKKKEAANIADEAKDSIVQVICHE